VVAVTGVDVVAGVEAVGVEAVVAESVVVVFVVGFAVRARLIFAIAMAWGV
jgi:hypothetical protein